jgi:hypothetical protein
MPTVAAPAGIPTLEARAQKRARYLTGLLWHAGSFLIINASFWILDLAGGGGLDWAYWITGVWGFALAFHALAYAVEGRGVEERKHQDYLDAEKRRAESPN